MTTPSDQDHAPPVVGSNALRDLAVRINAEHEAACAAIKSGAEHAMAAGDLLIEAKAALNHHGAWLPWLQQNCEMSERTAQLYMRMARNREAIVAAAQNRNGVADLSLRGAMAMIAPPKPDAKDFDELAEWFEQQLEEPFTDWDFDEDGGGLDWLQTKIVHCAGLPHVVQFALMAMRDYPGVDALAMCTDEELAEALELLAPYVRKVPDRAPRVSAADPLKAIIAHRMASQAIYIILRDAFTVRQKLSDERLEKNACEARDGLLAAINAKAAELELDIEEAADIDG
jgi:hypothetical protein